MGMMHYKNMRFDTQKTAEGASKNMKNKQLLEACKDFEALFVKQMLDSMRKTIPDNGLLDSGMGGDFFEDMLYDEYASLLSRTADLGLAEMIYNRMK